MKKQESVLLKREIIRDRWKAKCEPLDEEIM